MPDLRGPVGADAHVFGVLYRSWPRPDGPSLLEFLSDGAEQLLEATADEVAAMLHGRTFPITGIDPLAFYSSIAESKQQRMPWVVEFGYIGPKTGRVCWFRAQDFPQVTSDGTPFFTGMLIDVTPLKHAENDARRAYRALSSHMDNTPLAVIEWDSDFRVVRWTGQAEAIFGWSAEEILGKRPNEWAFIPPDERDRIDQVIARLQSGTDPQIIVFNRNYHKSGRELHCEWHNSVVVEDGAVASILSLVLDLTERRKAEAARVELERELMEARRAESLGMLAGGVAHDFNNLLTVILGNAGLARMAAGRDSEAAQYLRAVETAGHRAAELCRQITAYAGTGRFVVEPVDLAATIRDIEPGLRAAAGPTTRLTFALAPGLPAVAVDPSQLRQLIANLVQNAAEAVDRTGTVRVEAAAQADGVVVRVRDDGAGMTTDQLARIFDPFYTTKSPGRGLGLAAVQGIAKAHRATIQVESVVGLGTTVEVHFPADPEPAKSVTPLPTPITVTRRGAGKALVADDETNIRELAAVLLEDAGFEVIVAADGPQALAAFRTDPTGFRIVIADQMMPGMTGEEVIAAARRHRPDLPAVLMSGYAIRLIEPHPATIILAKPFRIELLTDSVRRALAAAAEMPRS